MKAPLEELDDWKLVDSSQDIRGRVVKDADGRELGKIASMMIDTDRKRVESVVLESGAILPVAEITIGDDDVYLSREYMARSADVAAQPTLHTGEGELRIPVIEEEMTVGKRTVESHAVKVRTTVETTPVEEAVKLRTEEVTVDRRPANRDASEADFQEAAGSDGTEIHGMSEEAVVSKTARVVGEIVVEKTVEEHTETIKGTERRMEVKVVKEDAPDS